MGNKFNIYKDEHGQYHEVEEDVETPLDGFEDDEDFSEDEEDDFEDLLDSPDEDDDLYDDEDEDYANDRRVEYDNEE